MGCILAELLQRKPLFAGKDYIDQLKLIIKTLGSPSDSDLSFINSQKAQQYIKALPKAQVCAVCSVLSNYSFEPRAPDCIKSWVFAVRH